MPAGFSDAQASVPLLHQVVVAQLAAHGRPQDQERTAARLPGAEPQAFKQKGTVTLRQGSIRAPHMTGGGVVHGPTPRNYAGTPQRWSPLHARCSLRPRSSRPRPRCRELHLGGKPPRPRLQRPFAAITEHKNILLVIARAETLWLCPHVTWKRPRSVRRSAQHLRCAGF